MNQTTSVKVVPLFSGSSGNATYIRFGDRELLVDAGVSCKALQTALETLDTGLSRISGIFVTHEHHDHIRGLETVSKKFRIPVYMQESSYKSLDKPTLRAALAPHVQFIAPGETVDLGDVCTSVFKTPHDACGSVGFRFNFSDGSSLGYATDIGYVTKGIAAGLFGCQTVILESNYDVQMLKTGPYPYYLKQRIESNGGHLSNDAAAAFVPYLLQNGSRKIILAHLSEENNTPRLAYDTCARALDAAGAEPKEYKLTVAMKSIL